MLVRSFRLACLALLGCAAMAQDGAHGHGHGGKAAGDGERSEETKAGQGEASNRTGKGVQAAPIHRPQLRLSGDDALAFVQAQHERTLRKKPTADDEHAQPQRPAGAGRYVCAVLACADSGVDVCATLGLSPKDVLLIQNTAATADADTAELLARAAATHGLSLVIVLAHDGCESLGEGARKLPESAANAVPEPRVEQRAAPARAMAARLRVSLAHAHALRQQERLAAALRDRPVAHADCNAGEEPPMPTVRVVAATIDAATGRVAWRTQRADSLPIAPVR